MMQVILTEPRIYGSRARLKVNSSVVLNDVLINLMSGEVEIKDNVFFGHGCMLITGSHDYHATGENRKNNFKLKGNDIFIGSGVWVGSGVTILGPARIGDNCVLGAGSVILGNSNFPENSIIAGVPGRIVKMIN